MATGQKEDKYHKLLKQSTFVTRPSVEARAKS